MHLIWSPDYFVQGSSSSFTIQLRVIKFHLEPEQGTDVLKIYDGADSTYNLIGAYYGTEWPPHVIESNSNWMNVVFESDAYRQYGGFNFTYQIKGMDHSGPGHLHK